MFIAFASAQAAPPLPLPAEGAELGLPWCPGWGTRPEARASQVAGLWHCCIFGRSQTQQLCIHDAPSVSAFQQLSSLSFKLAGKAGKLYNLNNQFQTAEPNQAGWRVTL